MSYAPHDRAKVAEAIQEIDYLDKFNRHKALTMMATGAILGITGFVLAAIGGYWNIFESWKQRGAISGPFPSNQPYLPLTVSEMVSDPGSAAGKTFLAFELCAAIMILGSWYPYMLSNVYVNNRHEDVHSHCGQIERGCLPTWTTVRQFLPMTGLFLVALVSVTPPTRAQPSDFVTNQIHILAATALFGGYILCEVVCLFVKEHDVPRLTKKGAHVRACVIIACAICAVTTIVLQFTYPYSGMECMDKYEEYSIDRLQRYISNASKLVNQPSNQAAVESQYTESHGYNEDSAISMIKVVSLSEGLARNDPLTVLTDTASGACQWIKCVTFWSEVFAGVLGLGSHLVIWYYSPERKLKLGDDNEFMDDDIYSSDDDPSE